jgi:hypothetical protein
MPIALSAKKSESCCEPSERGCGSTHAGPSTTSNNHFAKAVAYKEDDLETLVYLK